MTERVISFVCVVTAVYYIYTAFIGLLSPYKQIVPLLAVTLALTFLRHPKANRWPGARLVDYLLVLLSIGSTFFIMVNEEQTGDFTAEIQMPLVIAGGILLLVLLEAARRAMGWVLPSLSVVFILYALFGNYIPGILHHSGFSVKRILDYVALTQIGIFGIALYVICTIVIYFLIFGAMLRVTGGGQFFIDLALSLVGKYRGGPAKVAVVASSLMGTVSGSTVANVVTTGTFTIPMMKQAGYKPAQAGAIETLASTGGIFMPPVMGATAFIMADVMGILYWDVCIAAIIPAIIYYISLFLAVDTEAVKQRLFGLPKNLLPSFWGTLSWGWVFILALGVLLFWLAVVHGSPRLAALYSLIVLMLLAPINKRTRPNPQKIYHALAESVKGSVIVVIACACVGIIIGTVSMTSLGLVLSDALIELSQGIMPVLLLLVGIIGVIFGMGMPPPPVYIFLALTVVPALVNLGVNFVAAHMFVFYYGCLSNITPPVGICFFAAAPIAEVHPLKIGWAATRLGLIAFLLPFIFALSPGLVMEGTALGIFGAIGAALLIVFCLGAMLQGHLFGRVPTLGRVFFGAAAVALVYAEVTSLIIGGLLLAAAIAITLLQRRRHEEVLQ